MQGYPPPSGYGPPPSQGYGPAPGYYGGPPPKKGMNGCLLALLIVGGVCVVMFGGCVVLGMIAGSRSGSTSSVTVTPATATSAGSVTTETASAKEEEKPKMCAERAACVKKHTTECTFSDGKQVSTFCLAFKCTNEVSCNDQPPHKIGRPLADGPFDIATKGSTLFNDYQENEVAADNKYKHKTIIIQGDIASIRKDFSDDVIVGLTTSNEFMPVDARLAAGEDASKLVKGHTIGMVCKGDGMIIGRPQLKKCEIVEVMTGAW